MEPKEYPIPTFSGKAGSLEFLDSDGNPFRPSQPVVYKIIGEDGGILKDGTIEDDNVISLEDIPTRKFRVVVDSYVVAETEGFQHVEMDDQAQQLQEQQDDANAEQKEESTSERLQPEEETPSGNEIEGDWK